MKKNACLAMVVTFLALSIQAATVWAADESRPALTPRLLAEILLSSAKEMGGYSDVAALLPDIVKDKHFLRLVAQKLARTGPAPSAPSLDERGKSAVEYLTKHGYAKGVLALDDMDEAANGSRTYFFFDETGRYTLEAHQGKDGAISVSR